jgi:hypothetical protein
MLRNCPHASQYDPKPNQSCNRTHRTLHRQESAIEK